MARLRRTVKEVLARIPGGGPARGATFLVWHRVGGGTGDELDVPADAFRRQLDALAGREVVSIDAALDRLEAGDDSPTVVITFDDGFADVHDVAFPLLAERGLPFTVYLAAAYVDRPMRWEGATAREAGSARGLSWGQLREMVDSGLCTVGNHTFDHVPPDDLDADQLDRCSDAIEANLGTRPAHFAYPWGIPVPRMRHELAARFRSAATVEVGRNLPGDDLLDLRRVPVRRTDPESFFAAKLDGRLAAERSYAAVVRAAKAAKALAGRR